MGVERSGHSLPLVEGDQEHFGSGQCENPSQAPRPQTCLAYISNLSLDFPVKMVFTPNLAVLKRFNRRAEVHRLQGVWFRDDAKQPF